MARNDASVDLPAGVDHSRRKFLTNTTLAVGAVGALFTAVPFIESWLPSERARAEGGPVSLDFSKLEPGQMTIVTWRRKPIYIVRRTPAMLSLIGNHDGRLKDPESSHSEQPPYAKIHCARAVRICSSPSGSAHTSDVYPRPVSNRACRNSEPTGPEDSSALATAHASTWRAGSSMARRRQ